MSVELKMSAKMLAADSRILRTEEKKLKAKSSWERLKQEFSSARQSASLLDDLYRRRTHIVRKEARAVHLARAYLKGLESSYVEFYAHTDPDLYHVADLVSEYEDVRIDDIEDWYYGDEE